MSSLVNLLSEGSLFTCRLEKQLKQREKREERDQNWILRTGETYSTQVDEATDDAPFGSNFSFLILTVQSLTTSSFPSPA